MLFVPLFIYTNSIFTSLLQLCARSSVHHKANEELIKGQRLLCYGTLEGLVGGAEGRQRGGETWSYINIVLNNLKQFASHWHGQCNYGEFHARQCRDTPRTERVGSVARRRGSSRDTMVTTFDVHLLVLLSCSREKVSDRQKVFIESLAISGSRSIPYQSDCALLPSRLWLCCVQLTARFTTQVCAVEVYLQKESKVDHTWWGVWAM